MPAPRKPRKSAEPASIHVRLDGSLLAGLDRWLDELNRGRYPRLTRLDLIRSILARAVKERCGAPP